MNIYGSVIVHGKEYDDDEITTIDPTQRLLYGIDWVYGGDQFFEESGICWELDNGASQTFGGRSGLNDFLNLYYAHG